MRRVTVTFDASPQSPLQDWIATVRDEPYRFVRMAALALLAARAQAPRLPLPLADALFRAWGGNASPFTGRDTLATIARQAAAHGVISPTDAEAIAEATASWTPWEQVGYAVRLCDAHEILRKEPLPIEIVLRRAGLTL